MKTINIILFCTATLLPHSLYTKNTITTEKCGRLGDSVVILSKALVFAHRYNLDFLYTLLPGLKHFAIDKTENKLSNELKQSFEGIERITTSKKFTDHVSNHDNTLYITTIHSDLGIENPLWPDKISERSNNTYPMKGIFEYTIEHPEYLSQLRQLLTPIKEINTLYLYLRDECISVALHVRKPSGTDPQLLSVQQYDSPYENNKSIEGRIRYADKIWPLKFPPDQYYINQIKKLSTARHDLVAMNRHPYNI